MFGAGYVFSELDFVQIFGIEREQLESIQKASRLNAKSSLNGLEQNPYLVNDRTYVDISDGFNQNEVVANSVYQVTNNLTSFLRETYFSSNIGVGVELHLSARWDMDLQTSFLSRIRDTSTPITSVLRNDFSTASTRSLRISLANSRKFLRLSIGLNRRF